MFPAGLPGYTTRYLRLVSGLNVRVIEALASRGGTPALFVHGWGCSAFVWRHNLPAIAAGGIRALAVDLPGHGLSDKPLRGDHYSPDAMADAVVGALDALELDRAALVGHSLGGAVVMRARARAPERVSAMVLIAPVGIGRVPLIPMAKALTPRWVERVIPRVTFRWAIAAALWFARSGKMTLTARDIDEYWAPTQFPEMALAARRMLHEFDWKPRPSALGTRTLVIVADGDRLVHAPKDAGYRVIRGAGHNVQEQAPDEVNALVLSFLTA